MELFSEIFSDPTEDDVRRMNAAVEELRAVAVRVYGFPGAIGYDRALTDISIAVNRVARYVDSKKK